jgi:glycosyltransferase involved in cell wall biosynthesis
MNVENKRILFLYTELAGYFLACLDTLAGGGDCEILLIHWPVNKEAPFRLEFPGNVKAVVRSAVAGQDKLEKLASDFGPDLIYCSGWIDKGYVKLCRRFNGKIPVVAGFDNWWRGTIRQRIAAAGSFLVRRSFSHAWVPGKPQLRYAEKLGFPGDHIRTGVYSADLGFFNRCYAGARTAKEKKFPHRFIYVGRYYDFKGITEMWDAFEQWKAGSDNDWELWCAGTGDLPPRGHPSIRHFGFVQPTGLPQLMQESGVFILPSRFEPWGVVVHEFAAAGFPLLLSREVGASGAFLREGENGFSFPANDSAAIARVFESIAALSDETLLAMGARSHALAQTISPATWAATIRELAGQGTPVKS